MLKRPAHALLRLLGITLLLFVLGLLPWVDNYAHVFGFIFGFLLSYALLPFVSFGPYDRQRKIALIWVCLLSSTFLFAALIALFYVIPVYDCEICNYFNCLPLTRDFCAEQNINLKRDDGLVWRLCLRLVRTVRSCFLALSHASTYSDVELVTGSIFRVPHFITPVLEHIAFLWVLPWRVRTKLLYHWQYLGFYFNNEVYNFTSWIWKSTIINLSWP